MAALVAASLFVAPAMAVNLPFQQQINQAVKEMSGLVPQNALNNPKLKAAVKPEELQLLHDALGSLSTARADYKGHRVRAMEAVSAACTLLGGAGASHQFTGKSQKSQFSSDMQMRNAQASLSEALAMAGNQPRVKKQINTAINELNKALKAK